MADDAFASRRVGGEPYVVCIVGGLVIGAAGSSPSLTTQMYQKMFAQVDADADGSVSLNELMSIQTKAVKDDEKSKDLGDVFNALDRNADGKLQSGEFVPDKLFDNATLGTMLSAQEYVDADPETRAADNRAAVDALFERADINGDGWLDQSEMDAEKALRRAETLDTGKPREVAYLTRATEDGKLSRDDIFVGRLLPLSALKAPELPPEMRESFERVKGAAGNSTGESAKPRTMDDLRTEVQTELDTKPLSTAMISRLFAQLSSDAFSRASTASPVDQLA